MKDNLQNQRVSTNGNGEANGKVDDEMIDLNANPQRVHEPASNNNVCESLYSIYLYKFSFFIFVFWIRMFLNEQGIDVNNENNHEPAGIVPVGPFKRESEKW